MKKVVVIGSVTMDVMVKSKALKATKSHEVVGGVALCEVYGGKIVAEEMEMISGGGATNVAVGLKRLGLWSRPVGFLGNDDVGSLVEKQLVAEGLDLSWLQRSEDETPMSVVLVADDGGRSILTHRGKAAVVESAKIDWDAMASSDWCQVTGSLGSMELLEDVVAWVSNKGIEFGINPGKYELLEKERFLRLLPKINYLSLNKMEAVQFWGEKFERVEEKVLAKKFIDRGVKVVSITDGKRGAGIVCDGVWVKAAAYKNVSVDDTGAGDAFVSGVVSGILKGVDIRTMLKMGLANGGSVVTYLGAKKGLLSAEEMDKWLAKELMVVEESI